MSIGKSSIKRAANNGYSNVATSAPDMENSVVVEPVVEAPVEEVKAPVTEVKAPAKKKTAAKKPAAKKPAAKKPCAPKVVGKDAEKAVCVGQDLPYYLL